MEIQNGKYTGILVDYGLMQSKEGNPLVVLEFAFDDAAGVQHKISWYGSLKKKTGEVNQYTIDSLLNCGFVGNKIESLFEKDAFKLQNVTLVIENEADDKGKIWARIKYINPIKSFSLKNKLKREEAAPLLQPLNLEAVFVNRRKETGVSSDGLPF